MMPQFVQLFEKRYKQGFENRIAVRTTQNTLTTATQHSGIISVSFAEGNTYHFL